MNARSLRPKAQAKLRALSSRARSRGTEDVWEDALVRLDVTGRAPKVHKNQVTFCMPWMKAPDLGWSAGAVSAAHALRIEPKHDDIRVVFFPPALQLCTALFVRARADVPFETEKERHVPWTRDFEEQWYVPVDERTWRKHRNRLCMLAISVVDAWNNELRRQRSQQAG